MTEGDWLECADPHDLLRFIEGKASDRKLLLFVCACYRRIWYQRLMLGRPVRRLVQCVERYVEGEVSGHKLGVTREAARRAWRRLDTLQSPGEELGAWATAETVSIADVERAIDRVVLDGAQAARSALPARSAGPDSWETQAARHAAWQAAETDERQAQADLLRDLLGNPFQHVRLRPEWLHANGGCVVRLAQAVYLDQRFDGLQVLSDALLDAGCDDEAMIAHCHSPLPHARGCWLLDALLGKT